MAETHPHLKRSLVPGTWSGILVLAGFILIGMAVGAILAQSILNYFGGESSVFFELNSSNQTIAYTPERWRAIVLIQAISHICTFLVPSLLYWIVIERRNTSAFYLQSRESYLDLMPIFLLTIILMPFTGLVAEWNERMSLPPYLKDLEIWMKESEATLGRLTEYLLSFQSYGELAIALIVIAVIPAIGEEVLFRGILQRKLAEHWANVHLAIWVTAFLFSAIHFQFYGFFPRLFLGAMFGYLYFWTGRLSMAMFAHFVNNGVTVVLMWLNNQGAFPVDIGATEAIPVWMGIFSLILSVLLLRVIYRASPESEKIELKENKYV
jgi:membrane protease YdiL (CAAX protease family)